MSHTAEHFAYHHGEPVWRTEQPAAHRAPPTGIRRCRTAVVGAGLTGLSVALRLVERDPGHDVVVLEADRVGGGASTRGTGLVGPRIGPPLPLARKRFGDDTARALYLWSERAVDHVLEVCARHRIDCGLTRGGQLMVARDRRSMTMIERELAAAAALGVNIAAVPAHALPHRPGRYLGGMRYGPAATLDPAALTRQLAAAAERLGVTIHENSAVRRIHRGSDTWLSTDGGEIVADRVVLAVNGTSGGAAFGTGVIGLRVQAAATAPLTGDILADLARLAHEPLVEMGTVAPYYRLTPDNRLIVGGGRIRRGADGHVPLDTGYLRTAVDLLHPGLRDIPLTHAWSGPIGLTLDSLPVIGVRHDGALIAAGWRGHGIAASTYGGTLLADHLHENTSRPGDHVFPIARGRARSLPLVAPLAQAVDAYLALLGRAESRMLADRPADELPETTAAVVTAMTTGDETP
ncbi:NAD(P)/FAD-dependent oxidoreductase [Nocardia pseudobrasiliensis]|uniref:Glycine/D-amino acid oxidase-like deaminating enzyme n=1 Tax=Nocardia pseudobrasiliensis TaxID=45979 RepID=A0A370IBR0_9NOCA|nr:FAD-binding oxidoreductase [Nocardia pseudobrasiliensis]RDI68147.1 glycine/D-amino acid oxidase-like deaminating enzyme [Nocardia pseudobrasiliensis]